MDLIKKSVSVTENDYKLFIKRVVILFLKETKLMHYWYDYTSSKEYSHFLVHYLKQINGHTQIWYDREDCMEVFGMCDFTDFIKKNYKKIDFSVYYLFAIFLAIFDKEEFEKWNIRIGKDIDAEEFILSMKGHYSKFIDNWIKLKNALG